MLIPAQLIQRKRDGFALTEAEIRFFVEGLTRGTIPDYQTSALAMAIFFQGLTLEETIVLTRAMVDSGEKLTWPARTGAGRYADKHSTGGIGDKTSLILAPLLAACGLRVPMISGRGLGPTGGTLDKLESIPGFRTDLSVAELQRVTDTVGCVITGATPALAPADGKLYALRDVTATVACRPLIVASILSKKLAENLEALVLDVKWGSGAFMRTRASSRELAQDLVDVGRACGLRVSALQTDMNQPLGRAIGNALEVRECIEVMAGRAQPADLLEVTLALGAELLTLAGHAKDIAAAGEMMQKKLASGAALEKFGELVAAQGGERAVVRDVSLLPRAAQVIPIAAPAAGYVQAIDCARLGYAVIALGGGRQAAGERIDPAVGFEQPRRLGECVARGDPLVVMHANDAGRAAAAAAMVQAAYQLGPEPPAEPAPRIAARIA